jgi:hypothetical protein
MIAPVNAYADRILPSTRLGLWAMLALAVANGGFLSALPGLAATRYAWSITPPINAAFMGAGYLAGVVAGVLALFVSRGWRPIRALGLPFAVLGAAMLVATLVHADRFFWTYPPTWAWTAVYAAIPPAAVYLWLRQERAAGDPPEPDGGIQAVRRVAGALGAALIAIGAVLFAAPGAAIAVWPWPITPLLSMAFGAWYLLMGTMLLASAAWSRHPRELLTPLATVATWSVLLLLLPVLYAGSVRFGAAGFWPWLALQLAVLAGCGWAAVTARPRTV